MLRVAILDDHELFRKSLILLVDTFEGIQVATDAGNGRTFIDQLKHIQIDVALIDIMMPKMNGYETCRLLLKEFPDIKVLVVSQLDTRDGIQKIIECGASGFFSKKSNPASLEHAIHGICRNGYYFSAEIVSLLREVMALDRVNPPRVKTPSIKFSAKELQILKMAAKELNSQEIADRLFINNRTVDSHRKKIMQKTGSRNFTGAIVFAISNYYISLED